ncbi:hypothetical protein F2Q69_00052589 [Brassica cretica]|uniref:Protein kinase domain-containing protein n=1 Tax=Brassica cretica TaxID=69181 RepID=A0A8S9MSZ4_BRACR|nr:hypothetical protein F2Q69_00052589 [Brassica cretica]
MAVEKNNKVDNVNVKQRNIVLVGIKIDESGKEILKWALEAVAGKHGECDVVVIHVCSSFHSALKSKSALDRYLELYSEFCSTKKIELKGDVLKGNSVQGVLVKEANRYNAMSIIVGVKHQRKLRLKVAKGCSKELPPTTDVLAIHRGDIIFRRSNHSQPPLAQNMSSRPSSELFDGLSDKELKLKSGESMLSDFGLSMWGSKSCLYTIQRDVVGTFGYLAPEYFMYGKVSDKVDVYAFGVVLLELISGRTTISSDSPRGQESLVMWAKPIIEKGAAKELLDPNISGTFVEDQFQKMVLAAKHCLTRAATHRPNIREILKLLNGEDEVEKWVKKLGEDDDCFDDEVYPNSNKELHLSLAMLDIEDNDSISVGSLERSNNSLFSSSPSQELQP